MVKHYHGNSGLVRRIPDGDDGPAPGQSAREPAFSPTNPPGRPAPDGFAPHIPPQPGVSYPPPRPGEPYFPPRPEPPPALSRRPPSPLAGLSGDVCRLLSRLSPLHLETDDLLLILILYLMYRESRDEELLYILAALFIL